MVKRLSGDYMALIIETVSANRPKPQAIKNHSGNSIRKPYEKPAILHRELIESIAGLCESGNPINAKTGVGDPCTVIGS